MPENTLQSIIDALDCLEGKLHKQAAILTKASVACAFNDTLALDVAGTDRLLPPLVVQQRRKRETDRPREENIASTAAENSSEPLRLRIRELEGELEAQKIRHRDQLVAAEREIARLARARSRAASGVESQLDQQQLIRDV